MNILKSPQLKITRFRGINLFKNMEAQRERFLAAARGTREADSYRSYFDFLLLLVVVVVLFLAAARGTREADSYRSCFDFLVLVVVVVVVVVVGVFPFCFVS